MKWKRALSPFSTRRLFSREATFPLSASLITSANATPTKGKSRFARKKSPSGKRALENRKIASREKSRLVENQLYATNFTRSEIIACDVNPLQNSCGLL